MEGLDAEGLHCEKLTKVYQGSGGRRALDSVDLDVPSKGIFSLIGMNGAGKTTLVRILATQLEPTAGKATIAGMDVVKEAGKLRQHIATVPQEARTIPWMTPRQTVLSYLLWRGVGYGEAKAKAAEALARVGIEGHEDTLSRRLSGGMKRKVLVATVLASDADIVFLDEPTTGLDPISRRELWKFLTSLATKRFVILTTHYLEEAEQLASTIGILHKGRLIGLGSLEKLRQTVNYQYSIMITSGQDLPQVVDGTITRSRTGQTQILANEDEAYSVSKQLLERGAKFSMNKTSLDDVFFHLVHKSDVEVAAR
jgi:ABC-2 type transport system ATP-binding protein